MKTIVILNVLSAVCFLIAGFVPSPDIVTLILAVLGTIFFLVADLRLKWSPYKQPKPKLGIFLTILGVVFATVGALLISQGMVVSASLIVGSLLMIFGIPLITIGVDELSVRPAEFQYVEIRPTGRSCRRK